MRLTLTIPGSPVAYARPRALGTCPRDVRACAKGTCRPWIRFFTQKSEREWRDLAVVLLKAAKPARPLDGPVGLSVRYVFALPKGEQRVRTVPPRRWHVAKPDASNLQKAIEDALTEAGWWHDDAQVARAVVEKVVGAQGETACVHVSVQELEPL